MDQQELVESIVKSIYSAVYSVARPAVMIPAGVSNRHVHLCQTDVEVLFGKGAQLHPLRELSQEGFYAAKETVLVAGPKGAIANVRVLGPARSHSQVELMRSDTRKLGIQVPLRLSGQRAESQPITIVGPCGTIVENMGVIVAWRHIHMNTADAERLGLKDGDVVRIRTGGDRALILDQVIMRVADGFKPELHIDIDEANAADLSNGDQIELLL
ncbi:Phosphate propanoyltransferase [uncultured Clostridium sp.]|nr:phosphate propanoyltransferase [Clostridium sp.]SCH42506.1 Phosphate propanoyltransferase [uncultured Clostridium sp.]